MPDRPAPIRAPSQEDRLTEGAAAAFDLSAHGAVGEALAPGEVVDGTRRRSPLNGVRDLGAVLGPVGWVPLLVLTGLSAVERFDATAFGVLGPEIRDTFHLSNGGFTTIATFSLILPILLSVPIGYVGDRFNRVRLSAVGAVVWGVTAILTGLAPALVILILARLAGGAGQLVNEPVHASLLSDYHP